MRTSCVMTASPCDVRFAREYARSFITHNGYFRNIDYRKFTAVPELARACGISESGLYAFLRSYANTTPVAIKHRLIAERAVAMLTTTDPAVEAIASSLGLCSSAYLRRIRKRQTGRTPSQIRKDAKFI